MAVLESRPFLAPSRSSVRAQIDVVEPDTSIERIGDVWEPGGQRIVLRVDAELSPEFWSQTEIDRSEEILLVGIASCLPARESWRGTRHLHRARRSLAGRDARGDRRIGRCRRDLG